MLTTSRQHWLCHREQYDPPKLRLVGGPRLVYAPMPAAGRLRLLSCNGNDMTASYPELGVLAGRVNVPVSLDGEIIAIRSGRPDFGLLQSRMHVRRPCGRLLSDAPVQLYLFDLLQVGGEPLLGLPCTAWRAAARPAR